MVTVRFFAGARAAAGTDTHTIDGPVSTLAELKSALVAAFGDRLAALVGQCSYLVDGTLASGDDAPLTDAEQVDMLPPFAGG